MDLPEIEAQLQNPDFQSRLQAINALKAYEPAVAMPLLLDRMGDPEFLVRTFVAMGLGKQQTDQSFTALLRLMRSDNTSNVRAEAANSLSLFGAVAVPHLVEVALADQHWLVRRSIMAALADLECHAELYTVSLRVLQDSDATMQEVAIDGLAVLAQTPHQAAALQEILNYIQHESAGIRLHVAMALQHFSDPAAAAALAQLRQDPDHRVAAAALETLLP